MMANENETQVVALRREPEEVTGERRTAELVPQASKAVALELDREVCDLGSAVAQLSAVIKDIAPQDLSFEYSEDHSATRSTRHLRLRAYRKVG